MCFTEEKEGIGAGCFFFDTQTGKGDASYFWPYGGKRKTSEK